MQELPAPTLESILTRTLALMSRWAEPGPAQATLRTSIARQVVAEAYLLRQHQDASAALRLLAGQMHAQWVRITEACADGSRVTTAAELRACLAPAPLH